MFNGYFDAQSRCRFALTGYKLRQFPVNGGFTTLGRLERHEGLLAVATRFFSEIGYVGIIDVGFRFDARDSSYKLLDVNPRVGSTFRLFVDTDDHDVVRVCYDDLTGQSVPATAAGATARTWQVEPHDWRAGLELIRQGRTSLRGFLKSFTLVDEMAWWARDDPKPLAAAALSGLAPVFRRSPSARDAGLASG
jgi:predicted ATP-grasp superfamily ATP-dependent carboligase